MPDLRDDLQSALGSAYSLERELGGGGMSRVFLAEETALGRKVVVKVLPPELVAGVNVDRFRREIQLAARLQQAQIVPVLSAGELDGVPYFTMPFVEPTVLSAQVHPGDFLYLRGQLDSAESFFRARRTSTDLTAKLNALANLSNCAVLRGRLREARNIAAELRALNATRGVPAPPIADSVLSAAIQIWFLE